MNRREILKYVATSPFLFPLLLKGTEKSLKNKNFVLIELQGGNDGLNTLIPYSNPLYYKARPNIAIPEENVLKLNEYVGFHPSMKKIKELFDLGEVAVFQGLGYDNPNRSHFRSIEIWDTASKSDEYLTDGWLKPYAKQDRPIQGVVLQGSYGPLNGFDQGIIKFNNVDEFLRKSKWIKDQQILIPQKSALQHIINVQNEIKNSGNILSDKFLNAKELDFKFQKGSFGKQMEVVAKLIRSRAQIPFYKTSLSSFDTHINQLPNHARLLSQLSESIYTLKQNLVKSGDWDNTIIMTYSEFGRRVHENANKGTDHGTAAPHFIIGGSVKGGLKGGYPSLDNLDNNGDLQHTADFEMLYNHAINSLL